MIVDKYSELATSPFHLCLMIEVYKKDCEIPDQRIELCAKQIEATVSRYVAGQKQPKLCANALQIASKYPETLAFVSQMCLEKQRRVLVEPLDVARISCSKVCSSTLFQEVCSSMAVTGC